MTARRTLNMIWRLMPSLRTGSKRERTFRFTGWFLPSCSGATGVLPGAQVFADQRADVAHVLRGQLERRRQPDRVRNQAGAVGVLAVRQAVGLLLVQREPERPTMHVMRREEANESVAILHDGVDPLRHLTAGEVER